MTSRKNRSLLNLLLAWALGALVIVWAGFVAIGLRTGLHEADELTDGHLASTATLLMSLRDIEFLGQRASVPGMPDLKRHDYQQSMSVVTWDRDGRMTTRSGDAPQPAFDTSEGFATLTLGAPPREWRTFARWSSPDHERRLMVLLSVDERDDLAWDIAEQVAEPGLWMLPVVALALGLAIRRGLRPLGALSEEVAAIDVHHGEPLRTDQRPEEFRAVVESINALALRYQAAIARERQLAGELAHELRTPLASLALHAQSLQGVLSDTERTQATQRVAADALRAGDVLKHLLTLARASHTELVAAAVPLDVTPLAARVLAECAQPALDGGIELSLSGSPSLGVVGHEVLLELALRNLVENAIGHAPADSLVEVVVDAAARFIEVTNRTRGASTGGSHGDLPPTRAPRSGLGLGLGHRVVDKVASIHGARFSEVPSPDDVRRYRISFGPDEAAARPRV